MANISNRRFRFVYGRVVNTGVPAYIERELRPTGMGAPRKFTVALLLTAFILTFDQRKTATLRDVRRVLLKDLPRDLQVELGLRRTLKGHAFLDASLTYRKVSSLWERMVEVLDPNKTDDANERARRSKFLLRLGTIHTLAMTPGWEKRNPFGHAVDGTPLRGWHRKSSHWDKEARVGHRTPTPNDLRDTIFGYRILAYCTIGEGDRNFIEAFTVFAANVSEAGQANVDLARALVEVLLEAGRKIGVLTADKGFSQRKTRNWMDPMRALGFDLVFDLKTGDGGAPEMANGALMIDGRPYCPFIPEKYYKLPRPKTLTVKKPPRNATQLQIDLYDERRKRIKKLLKLARKRERYMGRHKGGNGWGPGDRWICPAVKGFVRCPLHEWTLALPKENRPRIRPHDGVKTGQFCTGRKTVIHWAVHHKVRQSLTWLSEEWCRVYGMRTAIERVFSMLKSRDGEALTHGWTRTKGTVAVTLMVWTAVAHYNLAQEAGKAIDEDDDFGWLELDAIDELDVLDPSTTAAIV